MSNLETSALTVRRGDKLADQRISVCIDCRWGIFKHHEYIFTSRGYVHKSCEDKRLST